MTCPHGDPFCPCQDDGDPCHYEALKGSPAMPCPLLQACALDTNGDGDCPSCFGIGGCPVRCRPHCHVEGCDWMGGPAVVPDELIVRIGGCGLLKIAPNTPMSVAYEMGCGAVRWLANGERTVSRGTSKPG